MNDSSGTFLIVIWQRGRTGNGLVSCGPDTREIPLNSKKKEMRPRVVSRVAVPTSLLYPTIEKILTNQICRLLLL